MVLDSLKQVTGNAGEYQIEGAQNVATLNIGGSATTTVSFIIGRQAANQIEVVISPSLFVSNAFSR